MANVRSITLVLLTLAVSTLRCNALLRCADFPAACEELQHQRCEDTDSDGQPDTCLCVSSFYLRITSCHVLPPPTGQGEAPISPCLDDNPCLNSGQCVYNHTIRHMSCTCTPTYTGLRCETEWQVCGAGEYLDEGTKSCSPCPLGTYKVLEGPQACSTCPPGADNDTQVTQTEGSTSLQHCMQGPHIAGFTAPYGPLAGSTVVNITVQEVPGFTISNITAITVAGAVCHVRHVPSEYEHNMTQCVTSAVPSIRSGPIVLTIRGLYFSSSVAFQYRDNPVINDINRTKTIVRGGLKMKIFGKHLDSVFTPLITITIVSKFLGSDTARAECKVLSNEIMECPTPDVLNLLGHLSLSPAGQQENKLATTTTLTPTSSITPSLTVTPETAAPPAPPEAPPQQVPTEEVPPGEMPPGEMPLEEMPPGEMPLGEGSTTRQPQQEEAGPGGGRRRRAADSDYGIFNTKNSHFWLGFELDGEDRYRNVSEVLGFGEILVYRDPILEPLYNDDPHEVYYHDYDFYRGSLDIQGNSLDLAAGIEDYRVEIGDELCVVRSLAFNALHCRLPPVLPKPRADRLGGPANIPRLRARVGGLEYDLGYIAYKTGPGPQVIMGIIIGAILVVIFIVVMVVIYCVRRRQRRKDKNANLQMGATPHPNIYSEGNPTGYRGADPRMRNGYLQPVHQVNGYNNNGTPRSSVSGNSLSPLMIPMPDSFSQNGYFLDGSGTPTTPTTPKMANNVAYQIPRHNSIPFEIMDCISEDLRLIIDECKVDSRRLQLRDSIGKGFFGKVYRGTFIDESGKVETTVAIKTIQGKECTVKDVEAFLAEAIVMKDCHNDNVLSLLGVVIAGNRPFAILPYMEHGDLKSYIAAPERSIKVRELLGFGVQVAAGMEYLTGQKIVHRDLATRNCMINKELTVRIADFGLSRDIYKSDYYRVEDKHRPLPVKWMAIESLTGGVFTSSSDVWSFGVLLWELLTRGCPPYPDIDTFNLKNYLLSGRRLVQPEHAPDEVYEIMASCWLERSDDRPNFTQLKEKLSHIVEEDEENMTPEYLKLI